MNVSYLSRKRIRRGKDKPGNTIDDGFEYVGNAVDDGAQCVTDGAKDGLDL